MAHYVICPVCGIRYNRDKVPCVPIKNRYAHVKCAKTAEEQLSKEQKDKKALEEYIMNLFGTDFVEPRVQKQIKKYIEENKYTYSGIRKALVYHYEVKHGDLSKARGGIGIVEYVYQDAFNYYKNLWEIQQQNRIKPPELFKPAAVKEITIPPPQRPIKKKHIFTFLDEEID